MPPAARITDMHTCPMQTPTPLGPVPHVGGPIIMGSFNVLTCFQPQARVTDQCICAGPPDVIVRGSPTVHVNFLMAARIGDNTVHGGVIVTGCPTVMIGEFGGGGAGAMGAALGGAAGMGAPFADMATALGQTVPVPGAEGGLLDDMVKGIQSAVQKAGEWVRGKKQHFSQEQGNSCVIASSRNMIYRLTGEDIPESDLRDEMREIMNRPNHDFERQGINPIHASELLRRHGVDNRVERNADADRLAELTEDGTPVMVGFRNPGHRVMLDGVSTDADGNRTFTVRDPAPRYGGEPRQMNEQQFNRRYNQNAIVIVPER